MYSFDNNLFRKIYGSKSGVYSMVNQGLEDIRLSLKNNHYYEIFSEQASILNLVNVQSLGDYKTSADLVLSKKQSLGIIEIESEIVQESSSFGSHKSALYIVDSDQELIAIIVKDSIFSGNYFSLFDVHRSTIYFRNTTFSYENIGLLKDLDI